MFSCTSRRSRNSRPRSEEHTSELQSRLHLVCRLLLEKKKKKLITSRANTFINTITMIDVRNSTSRTTLYHIHRRHPSTQTSAPVLHRYVLHVVHIHTH